MGTRSARGRPRLRTRASASNTAVAAAPGRVPDLDALRDAVRRTLAEAAHGKPDKNALLVSLRT